MENIETKSIQEKIFKKNRELKINKLVVKKQIEDSAEYKELQKLQKISKTLEEYLFFEKRQLNEIFQIENTEKEIILLKAKLNKKET